MIYYLCNGDYMIVRDKDIFIKKLFIYRWFIFTKFSTDIDDMELSIIINALNIKSRYKRINYIVDSGCDYIDNYYKECNLCKFKNNRCICHRKTNKDFINGCCRKCRYQSNKGCTTKNVACKMFNCFYVDFNGKKRLEFNDIKIFKVLNSYQRLVLKSDYFASVDEVSFDLYVGPVFLLLRFFYRFIIKRVIR